MPLTLLLFVFSHDSAAWAYRLYLDSQNFRWATASPCQYLLLCARSLLARRASAHHNPPHFFLSVVARGSHVVGSAGQGFRFCPRTESPDGHLAAVNRISCSGRASSLAPDVAFAFQLRPARCLRQDNAVIFAAATFHLFPLSGVSVMVGGPFLPTHSNLHKKIKTDWQDFLF